MKVAKKFDGALKIFLRACGCARVDKENGQLFYFRPESAEKTKHLRYCSVAFPLHSGGGDGPEAFFQGFRVARAEIVGRSKKSMTFFLFEILRDDAPELQPGRLLRKKIDEEGRFADPLFLAMDPEKLRKLNLWK